MAANRTIANRSVSQLSLHLNRYHLGFTMSQTPNKSKTMDRPFPAYRGDAPYIFVSYAHEDTDIVCPELDWMRVNGAIVSSV
jgi:hypothetical protein